MKQYLKHYLKKNVPARWLELFSYKAVSMTKIPPTDAVISDLFVLRVEDGSLILRMEYNNLLLSNANQFFNLKLRRWRLRGLTSPWSHRDSHMDVYASRERLAAVS